MRNEIPKDTIGTALNMYAHIMQIMNTTVKQHESDEPFLVDLFVYLRDGEFESANRLKFGLSSDQWLIVPELVRVFLDSFRCLDAKNQFDYID